MKRPADDRLAEFGFEVADWHRAQWPELSNPILPVVKVAEEAGELVGALVKYLEGRGDWISVLSELGDVVIAAAGAAARLEETAASRTSGTPALAPLPCFEELVSTRWEDVRRRNYGKVYVSNPDGSGWHELGTLVEPLKLEGPSC